MNSIKHRVPISEFVNELEKKGVALIVDGKRLTCSGAKKHLTPELLQQVSENKQDIIALLDERNRRRPAPSRIRSRAATSRIPLSAAQRPFFLLDALRGGNPCDHVCHAFRIEGTPHVDGLEYGLGKIVERHEVLRTTIHVGDDTTYQEIHPPFPVRIHRFDLSNISEIHREARARQICSAESHRPFDLQQVPLFRVCLISLAQQDWILLFVMHHIVSDAESFGLIFSDLEDLYAAFETGRRPRLPALAVQYADYAVWQDESIGSDALATKVSFWKDRIAGNFAPLDLPTDYLRPAVQSAVGAQHFISISRDLKARLAKVGQAHDATLFMTLLTVVTILLHRYSSQREITVGIPTSIRNQIEIEPLVGPFINVLVHRTQVVDDLTFRQLLAQVRHSAKEWFEDAEMPFDELVRLLHPPTDPSRNPLFQVLFSYNARRLPTLPGLRLTPFEFDKGTSQFDLSFYLFDDSDGVHGRIEYDSDLFDARRIERMAGHLDVLLRSVVTDPNCQVAKLPILTDAERSRLLTNRRSTAANSPADGYVHEWIQAQAAAAPGAVALVFEGTEISYAELDRRSNQLARYLRRSGVKPDVLVGICMDRNPMMLIGLLGILKAGGAYVPIDPSFPRERQAFMLKDSGAVVLMSEGGLCDGLPLAGITVVRVDQAAAAIARVPGDSLGDVGLMPEHLAYVIYTSGSTGQPKGVCVPHRALSNFLESMRICPGIGSADRLFAVTTLSFDIAGLELYLPLVVGARVILAGSSLTSDGEALAAALAATGATVMQATPATWRMLLEAGWTGDATLKVLCGGESLTRDIADRLLACCGELWNLYGPTETTVWSTLHRVKRGTGTVPVGRPIANTQVYVLDQHLQPTPIGVPGEVYVGGRGVARGYWRRPALTSESFVPDPFGARPDARLYRTGDVGRWRESGELELLGRRDTQVKLRGFRIELGEIEATLRRHSDVRQAAIVVRGSEADQRLVAYIVPRGNRAPTADALRALVEKHLPGYMVPAIYLSLEALPLTPNGKIDRGALPAPGPKANAPSHNFVAPDTPTERLLSDIWADILHLDQVGIHDNLFRLGGHSLSVILFVSRARRAGIAVEPRQVFEHQTIAKLATVIGKSVPAQAMDRQVSGSFVLAPGQQRFLGRGSANFNHWNVSLLLETRIHLDAALLEKAFARLFRQHHSLRLRFEHSQKEWRQRLAAPNGLVPFETCDLTGLDNDSLKQFVERRVQELQSSLNLIDGPTIRLAHFGTGNDRPDQVLLVAHHMICDLLSFSVLLEDLQDVYRQLEGAREVRLPNIGTSYQGWVQRLVDFANSPAARERAKEWLALPWEDFAPFPRDLVGRPQDNTNENARVCGFRLGASESAILLDDFDYAAHELMLAVVHGALSQWTGSHTMAIDALRHGRDDVGGNLDVVRTVGMFISYTPLVLKADPADSNDHLKAVVRQLREVWDRGWTFDVLRYLSADKSVTCELGSLPKAEVLFHFRGKRLEDEHKSFLTPIDDSAGNSRDPRGLRDHPVAIFVDVKQHSIQGGIVYCSRFYTKSSIADLATLIRTRFDKLASIRLKSRELA